MDNAAPGAVLLACTDDEVTARLEAALAPAGWPVRRARPGERPGGGTAVVVVCRPDPAAFVVPWRADPATAAVPVLALADRPIDGADSLLPADAPAPVLRAQVALLARLARTERECLA